MTTVAPHPRANPTCSACKRSKSGVCVKHASVSIENHERRCTGIKRDGVRCGRWAIKGTDPGKCSAHQDDMEKSAAAKVLPGRGNSVRKRGQRAATEALELLGQKDRTVDSLEELEWLAAETIDFKNYLRGQMTVSLANGADDAEKTIGMYVTALDRTGKLLETFAKQGIAEREIKLREELVGLVTGIWNTAIASYIAPEHQAQAESSLATAIAALNPPKQLGSGS